MTPEGFAAVIRGKTTRNWPDHGFCVARLTESVNWFDMARIFSPSEICKNLGENGEIFKERYNSEVGWNLPADLYDRTSYPMQDKAIALSKDTSFYL